MTATTNQPKPYIVAERVCKSFGAHQVLKDVSTVFHTLARTRCSRTCPPCSTPARSR